MWRYITALIVFSVSAANKQVNELQVWSVLKSLLPRWSLLCLSLLFRQSFGKCCFSHAEPEVILSFCPQNLGLTNLSTFRCQLNTILFKHALLVQFPVQDIYLCIHVTSHPGQLSLAIPSWVRAVSTSQMAVTPSGWGVKAGMVRVWLAGKTVWYHCYTRPYLSHIWAL